MAVFVSRKEHFNAAHKVYNPNWSKERNQEVFGKCSNENWHGHNYDIIVTVKGDPHPDTGFVIDLKNLSTMIKVHVLEKLDHRNLNLDVDFLAGKIPTTENLAIAIWDQISGPISEATHNGGLHSIRLFETPRNYVEYFG